MLNLQGQKYRQMRLSLDDKKYLPPLPQSTKKDTPTMGCLLSKSSRITGGDFFTMLVPNRGIVWEYDGGATGFKFLQPNRRALLEWRPPCDYLPATFEK